jgi:hypothetical protein
VTEKNSLLFESREKSKKLTETQKNFRIAAGFFLGGAFFLGFALDENHPLIAVPAILALFCMWSAHQVGGHINSLNREIDWIEKDDDYKRLHHLQFLVDSSLIDVIRP